MAGDDPTPGDVSEATGVDRSNPLELDTIFELFADRRRRYAIYSLIEAPGDAAAMDHLVDDVVRMEANDPDEAEPDADRRAVAADLHHWHLPVLEEVGVVTYDGRSGTIQFEANESLERWARRARRVESLGERDRY